MKTHHHPPVLVIIGPTASGKSDLAVELALRYGGEIISADSRQVYTSLFYTTGKIAQEEMRGVPHHMLDILKPGDMYNAHLFAERAARHIDEMYARGVVPIVTGGTGFYIDALLFKGAVSSAPSDREYRKELQERELSALQQELREKDPAAYDRIDINNPRRVIRALEVIKTQGVFSPAAREQRYAYRMIGIQRTVGSLRERIVKRLDTRFEPMIAEVESLLKKGVDPVWLEGLGLECRYISRMFTQGASKEKTYTNLLKAITAYAKRQNTWWRRYQEAVWFQEHQVREMHHYLDAVYKRKG